MRRFLAFQGIAAGVALAVSGGVAACGGGTSSGFGAGTDAGTHGGDGGDQTIDDGGPGLFDVQSIGEGGGGPDVVAMPGRTIAYAHDGTSLYSIDPTSPTLASTPLGKFDCIGGSGQQTSMTDIAVDKDGNLYGVATATLYLKMTVDAAHMAVHCTSNVVPINSGGSSKAKFYGMSFAPAGTLDPSKETLVVGNTDGELYSVDTTSGALTLIGNFGTVPNADGYGNTYKYPGGLWEMSGDIVFLANNGNPIGFATVRDCQSPPSPSNCNPTDSLVQIDLAKLKANQAGAVELRGQIVKAASCQDTTTAYGSMYGIAAFEDKVIGFGHSGFTVNIDNNTGQACALASGTPKWDGAGVTTTAPVKPPPPPPPPR